MGTSPATANLIDAFMVPEPGVIHVIPAIPACPVRPKSGHSSNALDPETPLSKPPSRRVKGGRLRRARRWRRCRPHPEGTCGPDRVAVDVDTDLRAARASCSSDFPPDFYLRTPESKSEFGASSASRYK